MEVVRVVQPLHPGGSDASVMGRLPLLLNLVMAAATPAPALAQQPLRTLPVPGSCPLAPRTSGPSCAPSSSGTGRGAIEKVGRSCPLGYYASGNYCLSSPSNQRQAIPKRGRSCPLGWFSSGEYCIESR